MGLREQPEGLRSYERVHSQTAPVFFEKLRSKKRINLPLFGVYRMRWPRLFKGVFMKTRFVKIEMIVEYENFVTKRDLNDIKYIVNYSWQEARSLNLETNFYKRYQSKVEKYEK